MSQSLQVQDHYFEANGIRHHYWSCGPVGAPVIVMLHGIRSYANTWFNTARELQDRYRIIALDLRGRGGSGWSAEEHYFCEDYVADLEALVSHLSVEKVLLLGHSLGGQNALVYTQRHPERVQALIVEDIGPGSSASGQGAQRIVREFEGTPRDFPSWEEATRFWRSIRPNISDQSLQQRVRETLQEDESGRISWSYDFEGIKNARLKAARDPSLLPDLWPAVDSLRCETLVIRGERSDFLPVSVLRAMAERNPYVTALEVSDATHYVHDDNFDEFIGALKRFLERLYEQERGQ